MSQILGWTSAAILVLTIVSQVRRQWQERSVKGVSPWLYVGQGTASTGLAVYSALSDNMVFVALNCTMAFLAMVGLVMWRYFRDEEDDES